MIHLPWDKRHIFAGVSDTREERLKQRITRALEKAQEDGVSFGDNEFVAQWQVQTLADRLYEKIEPYFQLVKDSK